MVPGLSDFHTALPNRTEYLPIYADRGPNQPFIGAMQDASAQVARGFILSAMIFYDLVDLGTGDEFLRETIAGIGQLADIYLVIKSDPHLGVECGGPVCDKHQPLDFVDVGLPPAEDIRYLVESGWIHSGIKNGIQTAFGSNHFCALLAQRIQIRFTLIFPMRTVLVAVDVNGETCQAGFF